MAAAVAPFKLTVQQQFVVDHVQRTRQHLLLFHETGTGKTICAAACAKALLEQNIVNQVAVICPLAVTKQWLNDDPEAKGWLNKFNVDRHVKFVQTIHAFYNQWSASSDEKKNELSTRTLLIIDETHLIRNTEILELPAARVGAVVFDVDAEVELIEEEIEQALEYKSKFMQSLIEFSDRVRNRNGIILALTATPMLHKPSDFSIYFRLLLNKPYDARKFTYDDAQFDARFGLLENFKSLACGLVSYYKNVKSEATGWAPVERTTVLVPLTADQEQLFLRDNLERGGMREGLMMRPQDTFRVYTRRWFLRNSDKMKRAIEFILSHAGKKHVVYSNFVEDGVNLFKKRLTLALKGVGFSKLDDPCIISSGTTAEHRKACVKAFNEGVSHVILLSQAGREGIDFKGANYMHMLDLPWSKADVLQIEGRVSRRGAHAPGEKVRILTYMCTSDTIRTSDMALAESIAKKEEDIAPYLKALVEVSIETQKPCPRIEEDMLRLSYYPDPKDLLYRCKLALKHGKPLSKLCREQLAKEVELVKAKALYNDVQLFSPVIEAEYTKLPMPENEMVNYTTREFSGVILIREGTTIKQYRDKYIQTIKDMRELSKNEFIIAKMELDAKRDAVLPRMYAKIKAAKDEGKYVDGKYVGSQSKKPRIDLTLK